jgi:flagellum-specific peptidoglycan hydrolase FlgJ
MLVKISERQLKYILEQAPIQQKPNQFTKFDLADKARDYVPPFTPLNFVREVIKQGIKHPDIVVAQALLESKHFKSDLFLANNNPFGMKFARQRKTTAIKENRHQAYYKNWVDAVKDYKLFQEARNMTNLSREDYLKKLNLIYCPPPACQHENYAKFVTSVLPNASTLMAKI